VVTCEVSLMHIIWLVGGFDWPIIKKVLKPWRLHNVDGFTPNIEIKHGIWDKTKLLLRTSWGT